jgi:hypothetical protein
MSSSLDFAPMLHNYGFGVDGVAQYALYLLNRLYDPAFVMGDLECLAAYIIAETASQDGKVGGAIQMATIATHGSQILTVSAVEEIVLANKGRSLALKNSFLKKIEQTTGLATGAAPNGAVHPIEEFSTVSDASSQISEGLLEDFTKGIRW